MSIASIEEGCRVQSIGQVRRYRIPAGSVGVVKAVRDCGNAIDVEFPEIGLTENIETYHFRLASQEDS